MKTIQKNCAFGKSGIRVAVIAILAAILILISSCAIVDKDLAKDKATCRIMNEILAVGTADLSDSEIETVREILTRNGVSEKFFQPTSGGYLFLYYPADTVILLTKGRDTVIFPDAYTTRDVGLNTLADLNPDGDLAIPHEHEYETNRTTTEATCTEKGSIKSTCSVCGKIYYAEIPAKGHDYRVKETVAPTCEATGYTVYECSRCHDTYHGDETKSVDHTPAEAVRENETAATCTKAGTYDEVVYCSVCHTEISRTARMTPIDGNAHRFTNFTYDKNQTCELNGTKTAHCDHGCGATSTVADDAHTALGHIPAEAVRENETKATCSAAGSYDEAVYCSVCNKELSRTQHTISALGHHFTNYLSNDATCTEDGTLTGHCSRCGAEDTKRNPGSATGHDYQYVSNGDNSHSQVCSGCNDTKAAESCTFINGKCNRCGATQQCTVTFADGKFDVKNGTIGLHTGDKVAYGTMLTVSAGEGYEITLLSATNAAVDSANHTVTILGDVTITVETKLVPLAEYTVTFYDTWNEETAKSGAIQLPEGLTSVTKEQLAGIAPEGWQASEATAAVIGNTVTCNGERHRTIDNADYTVVTNATGLYHVSGVTKGTATVAEANITLVENYILRNDIDLSSANQTVLGRTSGSDVTYTGIFDGDGHTVSGLKSDYTDTNVGMFALLGGTVRNLKIEATRVAGNLCIGVVAGRVLGGTVSNVHVTVSEEVRAYSNTTDWSSVGIGRASAVGGVCGLMDNNAKVSLCSFTGTVNGYAYVNNRQSGGSVGGICGLMLLGTIEKSWYKGSLNSAWNSGYAGNNIGGIAGSALGTSAIANCHAYVDYINGYDYEGGVVGYASSSARLHYCWAYVVAGGTQNGYYVGEICSSSLGCTAIGCYYDPNACIGEGKGSSMLTLGSGAMPALFDASVWSVGSTYPYLMENPYTAYTT